MPSTLPSPQQKYMPVASRGVASVPIQQISTGTESIAKGMFSLAQAAEQYQNDLDETVALNAINKLREHANNLTLGDGGLHSIKGNAVLERPVFKEFSEQFDSQRQEIAAGLTAQARKVFDKVADSERLNFHKTVMTWTATQGDAAMEDSYKQTVKVLSDNAALDPGNAEKIGVMVAQLESIADKRAARLGFDENQRIDQRRESVGAIRTSQVNSYLKQGNIGAAQAMLSQYKNDMRADDVLTASVAIRHEYEAQTVDNISKQVTAGVGQTFTPAAALSRVVMTQPVVTAGQDAQAVPLGRDQIHSAVIKIESGGDPSVVSKKGARGIYQVMPETAKKPGYGLKPADFENEADRARLGGEYLDKMIEIRGGDMDKALASYNLGPGAVDRLIASYGDKWKDHLPTETSNYLSKFSKLTGATPQQEPKHSWESMVRKFPGNTDLAMAAYYSQEPDAVQKDFENVITGAKESGVTDAFNVRNQWFDSLPSEIKDKIDAANQAMAKGDYIPRKKTKIEVIQEAKSAASAKGLGMKAQNDAAAKAEALYNDLETSRNQAIEQQIERYRIAFNAGQMTPDQVPVEARVGMGMKEWRSLESFYWEGKNATRERKDRVLLDDPRTADTYYNLMMNRNNLADMNRSDIFAMNLPLKYRDNLLERKREIEEKGDPNIEIDNNRLNQAAARVMGKNWWGTIGDEDKKTRGRIIYSLNEWATGVKNATGKTPTGDEMQAHMELMMTPTPTNKGWMWGAFGRDEMPLGRAVATGKTPTPTQSELDDIKAATGATGERALQIWLQAIKIKKIKENADK
jgi:soluble lytic murein transglycosylase-like protein